MRHCTKKCLRLQASMQQIVLIPLWSSRRCTLCAQFMTNSAVDHLIWTIEWNGTTSPPAFINSCLWILHETWNKEVWSTACCNYYYVMTFEDLHCLSKSLSLSKYKTVRHLHFWRGRMKGRWHRKCIFQGADCAKYDHSRLCSGASASCKDTKYKYTRHVELSCNFWSQNTK